MLNWIGSGFIERLIFCLWFLLYLSFKILIYFFPYDDLIKNDLLSNKFKLFGDLLIIHENFTIELIWRLISIFFFALVDTALSSSSTT